MIEKFKKIIVFGLFALFLGFSNATFGAAGVEIIPGDFSSLITCINSEDPTIDVFKATLDHHKAQLYGYEFQEQFDNSRGDGSITLFDAIRNNNRYDLCELIFGTVGDYITGPNLIGVLNTNFLQWYMAGGEKNNDVIRKIIAKIGPDKLILYTDKNIFHAIMEDDAISAKNKATVCKCIIENLKRYERYAIIQDCMRAATGGKTALALALDRYETEKNNELIERLAKVYVGRAEISNALNKQNDTLLSCLVKYVQPELFHRGKLFQDSFPPQPQQRRPLIEIVVGHGYHETMVAIAHRREGPFPPIIQHMCKLLIQESPRGLFSNSSRLKILTAAFTKGLSNQYEKKALANDLLNETYDNPSNEASYKKIYNGVRYHNRLLNQIVSEENNQGEVDIDDDGLALIKLLLKNGAHMNKKDERVIKKHEVALSFTDGTREVAEEPLGMGRNFMHKLADVMVKMPAQRQEKVCEAIAEFLTKEILDTQDSTYKKNTPFIQLMFGYKGRPVHHNVILNIVQKSKPNASLKNAIKESAESLIPKGNEYFKAALQGKEYTPPAPKPLPIPPQHPTPPQIQDVPAEDVTKGMSGLQKLALVGTLGGLLMGSFYAFMRNKNKKPKQNIAQDDDFIDVDDEPQKEAGPPVAVKSAA